MERVCKYCNIAYPITDFGISKTVGTIVYRRQKCRICYRKTKNLLKLKRRSVIDERKEALGCERCGIKDARVLEFHHRDSQTKDFAIADYYYHQFGLGRLENELAKCSVLCANCHRILHYEERGE
ncbi:MAG: hypothetical protein MUF19_02920 [Candidatus Pacebacteria bacterium]|jgi:hypothetical protein|nr:hypothetical protein [Candidatus Paceibacterota bacterium]